MLERFLLKLNVAGADFLSHLEELRRRVFLCLFVFGASILISCFFLRALLDFFMRPVVQFPGTHLVFKAPEEAFLLHVQAAVLSATLISAPFFFLQFWLFILPGLYNNEKRVLLLLIVSSTLLFLFGAWFGYTLIVPAGLQFLLGFQTDYLKPLLEVGPYFSFLAGTTLAFGIVFNLPAVVTGLVYFRVLSTALIKGSRKWAVVFIFILSAVLTPSPDPLSQIMLALPLLLLFEMSYWISFFIERRRKS